jgi:hypothetical protein
MTYKNKQLRRVVRHTVRFKPADDVLLSVLAERLGVQKATLIQSMTLQAAERELRHLGQAMCGASLAATVGVPAPH